MAKKVKAIEISMTRVKDTKRYSVFETDDETAPIKKVYILSSAITGVDEITLTATPV